MIVDTSPKQRRSRRSSFVSQARRWVQVDRQICLKPASASKGDIQQLNWFCEACKGITQSMNPPMSMLNHHALLTSSITTTTTQSRDGCGFGVCVICVDASSEAVCVPCGHVAGCISCLKEIQDKNMGCPVCRANIDQVIKLYHV